MKKMKKLTSLLLVLVMSLVLAVPAFATARESTYETKSNIIYPSGAGYNYEAYLSIYQGINTGACKAAVWVRETGYKCPPADYMWAQATLYTSSGRARDTVEAKNTANEYFIWPTTGMYGDCTSATGKVRVTGYGTHSFSTLTPSNRSLLAALSTDLTEDGGYPVNALGETYGSNLMAEIIGCEPDLVSAVGVDDVEGYVRSADLFAEISKTGAEIPLYDLNGNVIGRYEKHYSDVSASAASIEEAQAMVAASLG